MLSNHRNVDSVAQQNLGCTARCHDAVAELLESAHRQDDLRLVTVGNRDEDGSAGWQGAASSCLTLREGSWEVNVNAHDLTG